MFLAEDQPEIGVEAMTDTKSFADKVRGHATEDDSPHTHQAPNGRWTDVMKHCLPALIAPQMPIPRPEPVPESYARRR
jgi:hypothetical protein